MKKTRNIEYFGGSFAIIADNKPGENPSVVVMVDDGSGLSISIPSVMISYNDA